MVGALVGGLLGDIGLGDPGARFRWDLGPFLLAVLGAIACLLVLGAVSRRR